MHFWMPFYVSDYITDTIALTCTQHGAYLLLICAYWTAGKALPDDDGKLAAITKLTAKEWRAMRPVMQEHFTVRDGEWHHKRIDAELGRAGNRRARAKRANEARWDGSEDAARNAPRNAPRNPNLQSQENWIPKEGIHSTRAGARERKSRNSKNGPISEIYEAAYHAAEAINGENESRNPRNFGDDCTPSRPLLGGARKSRRPPDADGGLDR